MATTAHGKKFEDEFRGRWEAIDGKRAWVHRFVDSSDLHGLNNGLVNAGTAPADFLLAYDAWLGMADCKATGDPKGFRVAMVETSQRIAATRSIASGTPYVFAIKSMLLHKTFVVPAAFILGSRGTISWADLAPFLWSEHDPWPNTLMSLSTSRPQAPAPN